MFYSRPSIVFLFLVVLHTAISIAGGPDHLNNNRQVVPAFHASSTHIGDPDHTSSPWVVWNEQEKLWFMYFHYFNHVR